MWLKVISLGRFSKRCSTVSSLMPFGRVFFSPLVCNASVRSQACHCEFQIITSIPVAHRLICAPRQQFRYIFHAFRDMHVRVRQQETVDEPGRQVHGDRDVLDLDRSHRQFCIRAAASRSLASDELTILRHLIGQAGTIRCVRSLALARAITQRPDRLRS